MVGRAGTFHLKGPSGLQIEHQLNDEHELSIWFYGDVMVSQGEYFDRYLQHLEDLEQLADEGLVIHVHCHLEHLGEALSRAQRAIYRLLGQMRKQGRRLTIYATGEHPEQSEHLNMSRAFVAGMSRMPGPPLKLVEIRRAS